MKYKIIATIIVSIFCIMSCGNDTEIMDNTSEENDMSLYDLDYGLLPDPEIPSDNILTKAGVELGRMLFYEPKLSRTSSMACGDCHKQQEAFSDNFRVSIGVLGQAGTRQAMSVVNLAWNDNEFFWDGRSHLLRDQVLEPIQDKNEMAQTLENAVRKISNEETYRDQFNEAFGSEEVTSLKISLALEQFIFSITSHRSKYDKWLEGSASLTASEERGRELFFAEYNPSNPEISGANCAHCHSGANFENDQYLNNGLDMNGMFDDVGRAETTGLSDDLAKFKVPTLRNVELTHPYMHDGRFNSLEEVVEHYNEGIVASTTLDETLRSTIEKGLFLTETDKKDLVNFLKTLTDHELVNDERFSNPF